MVYWLIYVLWSSAISNVKVHEPEFGTQIDSMTIAVMNYDSLRPLLHMDNDTTYVINFWATWCTPCVQELPYFISLDSLQADTPFRLILVSLDFKKDYIRKLVPFVQQRELEDYVVVLEDNRANFWIEDIDPSWSGSIPATLVYRGEQRVFYERTFHHQDELNTIIEPFLE